MGAGSKGSTYCTCAQYSLGEWVVRVADIRVMSHRYSAGDAGYRLWVLVRRVACTVHAHSIGGTGNGYLGHYGSRI